MRPCDIGGITTPGADGTDGRFRLLRLHDRGGLGEVFVALDRELNREVALKRMQEQHADDPQLRARFVVEAEVTGGLEHPGIVPVYGLGTYPDGRPFYAMRFIRGDNLKSAVERFHADPELMQRRRQAHARAAAAARGGSSTSATRSPTPTAGACCIATSSPATSCWASTARRCWSTGDWPRACAGPSRRWTSRSVRSPPARAATSSPRRSVPGWERPPT